MTSPAELLPRELTVLGGRYRLLQRLGQGGHAEVFLAEQKSLGRKVALKIISRAKPATPDAEARFKREALLHSTIDHPSVVRVLDFETEGPEGAVVVLEYVEGRRLDELAAPRGLPAPLVTRLLTQLAEGLAAIHAQGIVHRDFKAENVMVVDGATGPHARILDFGLARIFDGARTKDDATAFVTDTGLVAGTPAYLSPEQLRGEPADPRADVYAFGITGFVLLTGRLPFPGPTLSDYVAQHTAQSPPSLRGLGPPALVELLEQCLAKSASQRPADGRALAALCRGLPSEAPPKPRGKSGRVAVAAALSLLVGAAPAIAVEAPWRRDSQVRWLLRADQPALALKVAGNDVAMRALALTALGRADDARSVVGSRCVEVAAALSPEERQRVGVSLSGCR